MEFDAASPELALALLDADQRFWPSFGFLRVERREGYIESFSEHVADHYTNCVEPTSLWPSPHSLEGLEGLFKNRQLPPAFLITPRSHPDWASFLQTKGYQVVSRDAYMAFDTPPSFNRPLAEGLVLRWGQEELLEDFMRVNSTVFSAPQTTRNPYGGIRDGYEVCYQRLFKEHHPAYTICFAVVYDGATPVGGGSICFGPRFAGHYGLAVVPAYRGKGIGAVLTMARYRMAPGRIHYLVTQHGSFPYKRNLALGMRSVLTTHTYMKFND